MKTCPYRIFLNQAGFGPGYTKIAALPFEAENFRLEKLDGTLCMEEKTQHYGLDNCSQDDLWLADFSAWTEPGEYRIVSGDASSAPFVIEEKPYQPLMRDLMRAFYYLRCGQELLPEHAGQYVHKACHTSPALEWVNHDVCKHATGGWHDAGDYGRYVTAGACALAHLLYAFRMFPEVLAPLEMNIPESGNGVPDVLNECRYELEWLVKMQREDGAVYHKETTAQHAPFVMPEEDQAQLYLLPVSSMATADLVAVCALASGIYRPYDAAFADKLLDTALLSYRWLKDNPAFLGFRNPEGCGTGGYGESNDYSNRFWAYAELYALTGEEKYHRDMTDSMDEIFSLVRLGYGEVGGFGLLAYLLCQQPKQQILVDKFKQEFREEAERLQRMADDCGYGAAMKDSDYIWGSNMVLMKHAMTFAIADELDGDDRFLTYARRQIDYLMGMNALGISYVTGNGAYRYNNPHLRPAYADGIEESIPGMVSGGPNRHPADADAEKLIPRGTPPMKCFVDVWGSYSTNEITIYWNSPTVFALAYVMSKDGR